jgi:Na+-driven multidrug efflux pump
MATTPTPTPTTRELLRRLLTAEGQNRPARTVELFGWLILCESVLIVFAPHLVASLLHLPPFVDQGDHYFRLVGLLVGGLGILYVVSGRLNSQEFVLASLFDRPAVPLVMLVLWYLRIVPGALAFAFSVQDGSSALWTWWARREQSRAVPLDSGRRVPGGSTVVRDR